MSYTNDGEDTADRSPAGLGNDIFRPQNKRGHLFITIGHMLREAALQNARQVAAQSFHDMT